MTYPLPHEMAVLVGAVPRTSRSERPTRSALWLQIDGLDALLAAKARLPNMMGLRRRGAWTWHAAEDDGVYTRPGWGDHPLATLFTAARSAGLHTAFVGGCRGRRRDMLVAPVDYFSFPGSCPWSAAEETASLLRNAHPELTGVQFAAPETAACRHGWGSPQHYAAIETCDAALGMVAHAIRQSVYTHETILIVTARRCALGAAGAAPSAVPWLCVGPRIPSNHEIYTPITPADSAALLAQALDLSLFSSATEAPRLPESQLALSL